MNENNTKIKKNIESYSNKLTCDLLNECGNDGPITVKSQFLVLPNFNFSHIHCLDTLHCLVSVTKRRVHFN